MATTKITITLDDEQLKDIRSLVESGHAASISGFVKHAVTIALHDAEGWKEMLETAILKTGGPLTAKEKAWADAILLSPGKKKIGKRNKVA